MIKIAMWRLVIFLILAFTAGAWLSGIGHTAYFVFKLEQVNEYNEESMESQDEFD